MEIILALFKYLTASLTPLQFLAVMAAIVGVAFFAVKWALKRKKALTTLFRGEDENLKAINEKLDTVVTHEQLESAITKLELIMRHELSENRTTVNTLTQKFVEISQIRHEIVDKEFSEVKSLLEAGVEQRTIILSTIKEAKSNQDRLLDQVAHIDEFMKAAVPEFRAYHRELAGDMKMLGRDLALIERSIQLSINTGNAVKLR